MKVTAPEALVGDSGPSFLASLAGAMGIEGHELAEARKAKQEAIVARVAPEPSSNHHSAGAIEAHLIREDGSNPRKRWGDLDDLAASIAKNGLIQPLVLRLDPEKPGHFIVVCGARRFRAGKQAGLNEFRAEVRELSEEQAFELTVVENIQRVDLHPMEEAEGYEQLKAHGYEVPTIAARVGKSTGWIYGRCKLLELGPEARAALFKKAGEPGKLELSVALVLARRPHANQAKALPGLERLSTVADQIAWLQTDFEKNLKGAPFDLKDTTLPCLPRGGTGDCVTCPANSNNAPRELFADYSHIEKAGICSQTPCFDARAAEVTQRTLAKAKDRGEQVLTLAETKKAVINGAPTYGSPFVIMNDVVGEDPKRRTWSQIFEKLEKEERPPIIVAPDEMKPGKVLQLADRKLAVAAAALAGATWAKKAAPEKAQVKASKAKADKAASKEHEQARLIATVTEQAMPKVVGAWSKSIALPELRATAEALLDRVGAEDLAKIAGWFEMKGHDTDLSPAVEKWITKTGTIKELFAFVLVVTLYPRWTESTDTFDADFSVFAKNAGVDLKGLTRALLEQAKVATAIKWKEVDGGVEGRGAGGRKYGVSYNGGDYFWRVEGGRSPAGGDCKSIEEGKTKCAELEAKAVGK